MFKNLITKIARRLDASKIPYMVIGGQALLVYGEPRLTKDIDITLGINTDELARIRAVIKALGLSILVKNAAKFVKDTMVLPAIERASGINVDFIFSLSKYERQAIGKAKGIKMGKTFVKFASLEDIIIHKVIAGRPRDIEDIKTIIMKNPRYDVRYITKWLREFDLLLDEDFRERFRRITKRG